MVDTIVKEEETQTPVAEVETPVVNPVISTGIDGQQPDAEAPKAEGSKFMPNDNASPSDDAAATERARIRKQQADLEELFSRPVDPEYADHVMQVRKVNTSQGMSTFIELDNGHQVGYFQDAAGNVFVGSKGPKKDFDQDQAREYVETAIQCGMTGGKLTGPLNHKEMMWLEAQMLGFPVDFEPKPESEIHEKLAERRRLAGMTAEAPAADMPGNDVDAPLPQKPETSAHLRTATDNPIDPRLDADITQKIEDLQASGAHDSAAKLTTAQNILRSGSSMTPGEQEQLRDKGLDYVKEDPKLVFDYIEECTGRSIALEANKPAASVSKFAADPSAKASAVAVVADQGTWKVKNNKTPAATMG